MVRYWGERKGMSFRLMLATAVLGRIPNPDPISAYSHRVALGMPAASSLSVRSMLATAAFALCFKRCRRTLSVEESIGSALSCFPNRPSRIACPTALPSPPCTHALAHQSLEVEVGTASGTDPGRGTDAGPEAGIDSGACPPGVLPPSPPSPPPPPAGAASPVTVPAPVTVAAPVPSPPCPPDAASPAPEASPAGVVTFPVPALVPGGRSALCRVVGWEVPPPSGCV